MGIFLQTTLVVGSTLKLTQTGPALRYDTRWAEIFKKKKILITLQNFPQMGIGEKEHINKGNSLTLKIQPHLEKATAR